MTNLDKWAEYKKYIAKENKRINTHNQELRKKIYAKRPSIWLEASNKIDEYNLTKKWYQPRKHLNIFQESHLLRQDDLSGTFRDFEYSLGKITPLTASMEGFMDWQLRNKK